MVLLKNVRIRATKAHIADRNSLEVKILRRIKKNYDLATSRYSNDYELAFNHFRFCKGSIFKNSADYIIQNMINVSILIKSWGC